MKHRYGMFAALLCLGLLAALAGLGLSSNPAFKALGGVLLGVGAGLAGMSAARLLLIFYESRHPQVYRQTQIEENDERNQQIRRRAKARAGEVTSWLVLALAFVLILYGAPLWLTLLTVGVYLAYTVINLFLMARYQKQM